MKKIITILIITVAHTVLFSQKDGGTIGSGNVGTVTSIGLTVPTGFDVSGSPVTGAGTIGLVNNLSEGLVKSDGIGLGYSIASAGDIPDLAATYFKLGGNTATDPTIGTNNTEPIHFETAGTRRFSIASSGIANTPASTKALILSSNDSLQYKILQSDGFGNTVTQSGSDTLLNSALNYGHFQRVGDIVTFTVRVEIALVNTGAANTIYFDPPIASNFTTASTDVIGTASMDSQGLSSANTAHQRCLLFASDSDDKIGISFDPVASLSYPENRMYISASGSYIIQ